MIGSRSSILNNSKIGKSVFLGANVTIGEGVIVDNNSKIVIGSVVTRNVGKNKLVVGNPAKIYENHI